MSDKLCGHGPNECDPRNPDCLSDIIASQNREINRLREELARQTAAALREQIILPYVRGAVSAVLQRSRDGVEWVDDGDPSWPFWRMHYPGPTA